MAPVCSKVSISWSIAEPFLVSERFGGGQGRECNVDLSVALRYGAFRIQTIYCIFEMFVVEARNDQIVNNV